MSLMLEIISLPNYYQERTKCTVFSILYGVKQQRKCCVMIIYLTWLWLVSLKVLHRGEDDIVDTGHLGVEGNIDKAQTVA